MSDIFHIKPEDLLLDTFLLGKKIYQSGFRPKQAISLWRGGTPVGLGIDAYFRLQGLTINHTTVATESFTGIDTRTEVMVRGLEHIIKTVCFEDKLLIIDDVFESGKTVNRICEILTQRAKANAPKEIMVATIHAKPPHESAPPGVKVISLKELARSVWIDYPHELADLVFEDDPEDLLLREKDEEIWKIIRQNYHETANISVEDDYFYVDSRRILMDSFKLGVNIFSDKEFYPDFIIALWPGGVISGLPIHEVFKYKLKKSGSNRKKPDHISINTNATHASFMHSVIGIPYLEEAISKDDKILIIDTVFRSGQTVNAVISLLKERLRRNLKLDNIRVASVFYNPHDNSTWTTQPVWKKPDYYLYTIDKTVIYPHSIQKLPSVKRDLKKLNFPLYQLLFQEN